MLFCIKVSAKRMDVYEWIHSKIVLQIKKIAFFVV